jgi:hypothetical protein
MLHLADALHGRGNQSLGASARVAAVDQQQVLQTGTVPAS